MNSATKGTETQKFLLCLLVANLLHYASGTLNPVMLRGIRAGLGPRQYTNGSQKISQQSATRTNHGAFLSGIHPFHPCTANFPNRTTTSDPRWRRHVSRTQSQTLQYREDRA